MVLFGTNKPFLLPNNYNLLHLPAVVLPTILVPPMVDWMTGINEPNYD